jgi:hypothetical protein
MLVVFIKSSNSVLIWLKARICVYLNRAIYNSGTRINYDKIHVGMLAWKFRKKGKL